MITLQPCCQLMHSPTSQNLIKSHAVTHELAATDNKSLKHHQSLKDVFMPCRHLAGCFVTNGEDSERQAPSEMCSWDPCSLAAEVYGPCTMSAPQGHAWQEELSERQTLTEAEEAKEEQTNAATVAR